jgi:hypothetical protein
VNLRRTDRLIGEEGEGDRGETDFLLKKTMDTTDLTLKHSINIVSPFAHI